MRLRSTIIASAAAALLVALPGTAAAADATSCDIVAAPNGSDSAAGTAAAPLRSATALAAVLADGQTACFRAGSYSFKELHIDAAQATVTSFPGETAELKGQLRLERTATGTTVENLLLNGVNDFEGFSPLIYADSVILRDNEITNEQTTNCVHLSSYYDEPAPANVLIEGNRIHDCGGLAPNHDHGIYIAASRDLTIANNVIYDNADRGIQLWPDAQGTHIYGNVIDGNGQGISIGGYEGTSPSHTLIEHNLITNSNVRHNVESYFPEDTAPGTDNIVRNNCIYGADGWYEEADGSGIQAPEEGFNATNNVIADPEYVNRAAHDYTLSPGSPCAGILDGSAAPARPLSLETTKPAVAQGAKTTLTGTVPSSVRGNVSIMVKRDGSWKHAANARVNGSTFTARTRVTKTARFKATAAGARDSNKVTVATTDKRKA
jgi:parallel beta-helix repeat protein